MLAFERPKLISHILRHLRPLKSNAHTRLGKSMSWSIDGGFASLLPIPSSTSRMSEWACKKASNRNLSTFLLSYMSLFCIEVE